MGSFPQRFQGFAHFNRARYKPTMQPVVHLPMQPALSITSGTPFISVGVFAWNEEAAIATALHSLFEQTLFEEAARRNLRCEIVCVGNGCTDRTPEIAKEVFEKQSSSHPVAPVFSFRVVNLAERGKLNAWNQYVHSISARDARFLFMMDADILIHRKETLWNMLVALETDSHASVSVDRPQKDIQFKRQKNWREQLSVGAAQMTAAAEAQLCAQLYCIRSEVARNIYLPKDLAACEDGFIKALVCTDFLAHEVRPERIRLANGAEHTFEAYTSPSAILKNQKRQIIGQSIVHVLVDQYLPSLAAGQKESLAATLSAKDASDPQWLKRLIHDHLEHTRFFWRLYPGLLNHRFKRLAGLPLAARLRCLPAAVAGFFVTLVAALMAWLFLKAGSTDYWPRAQRFRFRPPEESVNSAIHP
jgi:hypothetical protein